MGVFKITGSSFFEPAVHKYRYFLLFGIAISIIIVYLPALKYFFISDDFGILLSAKKSGFDLASLFTSITIHLQPIFSIFLRIQYLVFGNNPFGYHLINLILHLLVTICLYHLADKLLGQTTIALLASLLFGLSASHWTTTVWITTQGQLLAALFFLISWLALIQFIINGQHRFLIISLIFHLLMIFSFSYGIEIPLFYFLFLLIINVSKKQPFRLKEESLKSALLCFPFLINIAIFFILRSIFIREAGGVPSILAGPAQLPFSLIKAAMFVIWGTFYNLLGSFTGGIVLSFSASKFIIIAMSLSACISAYKSRDNFRGSYLLLLFLALWATALYFPAALARLSYGKDWFISNSRYLYLPALPASIAAAIFIFLLIPRAPRNKTAALSIVFLSAVIMISTANAVKVRYWLDQVGPQVHAFEKMVMVYLTQIDELKQTSPEVKLLILNKPFCGRKGKFGGWNVSPKKISLLFKPVEEADGITFFTETDQILEEQGNAYRVKEGILIKMTR